MKAAFIADIHANLAAMEKTNQFLAPLTLDAVYCLGDIIGYGDFPNEVIALLQDIGAHSIIGNHERMLLDNNLQERYNLPYTASILSDESRHYLANLPDTIVLEHYDAVLSHGVPFSNFDYLYANSDFSIIDSVPHSKIFMGHTHYPMLMSYYTKTIFNPGSIGQPRDGIPRISLLIFDFDTMSAHFVRI